MKRLKIVHVLASNKYSGAENVVLTIMKNIKDVDCIYLSPKGEIEERLNQEGVAYYGIDKLNYTNLKKAIKEIKPDVIHAHDFLASAYSSLVSKGKIPVISHIHNNPPFITSYGIFSILYYITCKNYNKILTVSDSVMDEYVFGDKLKYKSLVVGNPFDAQYIRYKADHAELMNQSDIIYLGRLTEQKNPFVFLDIIQDLKHKIPNLKVSMVGAGELESEVRKKIHDYALDSTITMYGFQENPYGLLKNSKVLCIPSKWEGFGLVAIEALSLGKPVVASNVGGLKNIINDECGFVGDNQEGLEKALCELLTDESIYTKKSNSALKRVKIYDNVDTYCKQLLDIYYECVK